jgi:hypothetical protein
MNWQDLGKQVADFAPLLGTALGGSLGTGIGSIVASTFGTGNDPKQISQAITADPSAAIKLKEIELTHKTKLEQIALETTKAELADKQNARQTHNQSKMPAILSVGLTLLIVLIIYLLFFQPIPDGAKEVLYMLLGVAVKEWGGAMQYWFGTTRSSSEKTKLLTTTQYKN